MRLALTEATERVAALRARAGRERGRVQEEVHLAVVVEVAHEDLLHVGERARVARVAREARVDMILVQSPANVVVVDCVDLLVQPPSNVTVLAIPTMTIHCDILVANGVGATNVSEFSSPFANAINANVAGRCGRIPPAKGLALPVFHAIGPPP